MSLPRKGLRKVDVDGVGYEWIIRKKPTYMQGAFETPMILSIQLDTGGEKRLLVVELGVSRPDNWISPHQTSVTPKVIRKIVRSALKEGWVPDKKGKPFDFKYQLIKDRP